MKSQRRHTSVYTTLFDRVIAGSYPPGTKLAEESLALEFGISRTPVREILRLLEQDGLVRSEPRRGVRVVPFAADDVEEVYDIRKALELLAVDCAVRTLSLQRLRELRDMVAALGASRDVARHVDLDRAIHGCIVEGCHRPRLAAVLDRHLRLVQHFRFLGFRDAAVIRRTTLEHAALLDALLARRADDARAALAAHLDAAKRQVLAQLCAPPARTRPERRRRKGRAAAVRTGTAKQL
ncbi:MAG: GntR family transcriptional regulator [Kiritimatiellae bacterium]|nr:GntR family transcriptional regulator [Kiritimatiellia bacterium]